MRGLWRQSVDTCSLRKALSEIRETGDRTDSEIAASVDVLTAYSLPSCQDMSRSYLPPRPLNSVDQARYVWLSPFSASWGTRHALPMAVAEDWNVEAAHKIFL